MNKLSALGAVVTLVLALAACHPPKSGETLGESIRSYNDGVRWQRFEAAANHVPPKERGQFVDDADQRAKDLRITEVDVVRVEKKSDRLAEVQVKLAWYLDSEGTLRETHAKQTWEKHGKSWWIVDEARLRGKEMPGLREPIAKVVREAPNPSEE